MVLSFSIGQLSLATECKVETIRYYEKIGLLPEPQRTAGNQRRYSAAQYKSLLFVLHARELGFSIAAIRQLLALSDHPDAPCDAADAIARKQLAAVQSQIRRLQKLEKELAAINTPCAESHIRHCRVMETLAACTSCYERHHHC